MVFVEPAAQAVGPRRRQNRRRRNPQQSLGRPEAVVDRHLRLLAAGHGEDLAPVEVVAVASEELGDIAEGVEAGVAVVVGMGAEMDQLVLWCEDRDR
jgi:hypothetical protein